MTKLLSVVSTRPNFIKNAPLKRAIEARAQNKSSLSIDYTLLHTGQHYNDRMSESFFQELNIPDADINLGVGSGSHAKQVGHTMIAFEKVLKEIQPDWVIVFGDVNATLACSLTACKENIRVCHVEAGLRSGDMRMPEEINRILTDRISDLLLAPDAGSVQNLLREGISPEKIVFTGNIMIDTLDQYHSRAARLPIADILQNNLLPGRFHPLFCPSDEQYALLTLHRPGNTDASEALTELVLAFQTLAEETPVIWPLHPRTLKMLTQFQLLDGLLKTKNILLLEPLGYLDMLRLNQTARILLTDSGGLQEESTVLGSPCITLRDTTERPVTLIENGGSSLLAGNKAVDILMAFHKLKTMPRRPFRPPLWDGQSAQRCLEALLRAETTSAS